MPSSWKILMNSLTMYSTPQPILNILILFPSTFFTSFLKCLDFTKDGILNTYVWKYVKLILYIVSMSMPFHWKKYCMMQPFNLWLYATNCHLQLYFVIFTTRFHHPFQSIMHNGVISLWLLSSPSFHVDLIFKLFIQERVSMSN
jgi:hypothetical protein